MVSVMVRIGILRGYHIASICTSISYLCFLPPRIYRTTVV